MPPKRKRTAAVTTEISDGSVDLSTGDLAKVLVDFVSSGKNSTVTCGGSIALTDVAARVPRARAVKVPPSQADGPGNGRKKKGKAGRKSTTVVSSTAVAPIALWWDRPDGSAAKVAFPVAEDDTTAFENFMSDCQPAVFGLQGEDVYDESVRKALSMDASHFATNLCPHALGIVDRIEQLLLPNVAGIGSGGVKDGGFVRAELYKINVYKGPSGFFKSHVDTPRGKTQFGSLVLCLPSQHEGGRLTVTHVGASTTYDWDKAQGIKALQWAALYSDCEHEVLPVTDGHRVTMTFNLYYEPRARGRGDPLSGLDCKPAPVDIASLAPYGVMQGLLQNPEWMTDGGALGIYCAHAYPTTTSKVADIDPRPRRRYYDSDDEDQRQRESSESPEPLPSDTITTLKGTDMSIYAVLDHLGLEVDLKPVIQKPKTDTFRYHEGDEFPLEVTAADPGTVLTSRTIHEDTNYLAEDMGKKLGHVVWVNTPSWRSLAFIHTYHGNEAEPAGITYSYMALVATIPPAAERANKAKKQKK